MELVTLISVGMISLVFVLGAISTRVENRRRDAALHRAITPSAASGVPRDTPIAGMSQPTPNRVGTFRRDDQQSVSASATRG